MHPWVPLFSVILLHHKNYFYFVLFSIDFDLINLSLIWKTSYAKVLVMVWCFADSFHKCQDERWEFQWYLELPGVKYWDVSSVTSPQVTQAERIRINSFIRNQSQCQHTHFKPPLCIQCQQFYHHTRDVRPAQEPKRSALWRSTAPRQHDGPRTAPVDCYDSRDIHDLWNFCQCKVCLHPWTARPHGQRSGKSSSIVGASNTMFYWHQG